LIVITLTLYPLADKLRGFGGEVNDALR